MSINKKTSPKLLPATTQSVKKILLRNHDLINNLEEETFRADQAESRLKNFLSQAQDQLRNPLNAIIGFSQLLLSDQNLLGNHKHFAQEILSAGQKLLDIIEKEEAELRFQNSANLTNQPLRSKFTITYPDHSKPPKIVIVEKNRSLRLFWYGLLIQYGFEVRQVQNCQDAMSIWVAWQPDCMLINPVLPGVSGIDLVRMIREVEKNQPGIQGTLQPFIQEIQEIKTLNKTILIALIEPDIPNLLETSRSQVLKQGFHNALTASGEEATILNCFQTYFNFEYSPIRIISDVQKKQAILTELMLLNKTNVLDFLHVLKIGDFIACKNWVETNSDQIKNSLVYINEYLQSYNFDVLQETIEQILDIGSQ